MNSAPEPLRASDTLAVGQIVVEFSLPPRIVFD